jgi:hypothetical protein
MPQGIIVTETVMSNLGRARGAWFRKEVKFQEFPVRICSRFSEDHPIADDRILDHVTKLGHHDLHGTNAPRWWAGQDPAILTEPA